MLFQDFSERIYIPNVPKNNTAGAKMQLTPYLPASYNLVLDRSKSIDMPVF